MTLGFWLLACPIPALLTSLLCCLLPGCDRPTVRPPAVVLVAPQDDTQTANAVIEFSWTGSAERFVLQLGATEKFFTVLVSDTVSARTASITLRTDGRYFWRVQALSTDNIGSAWSEVRSLDLVRFAVRASAKTQGYAQAIRVENGRAYIADGQAGLSIFDLSDPEAPRLVGAVMDSLNEAWGVAVQGDRAYLAYGYKELAVVDVSQPERPRILGELEYPQPGYGFDVALRDTMAYVAADAQFLAVGVADARYPNLVYQYRYPRGLRGVAVEGDRCYLALEQLGIAIWNVGVWPPVQISGLDTPANARSVAAATSIAYVADGRDGLVIVDATDPAQPRAVATLPLAGYANRVSVTDTLVYVGCSAAGLAIVNVKDPAEPFLVAQVKLSYTRGAVEYSGYIFACDRDMGLVVIGRTDTVPSTVQARTRR